MKVLVIDNEPTILRLLQRYLGAHGYDVAVAGDGTEGWIAARDGAPDLIVSDVSMPGMDGYELVRTLRSSPSTASIPIILISAHSESDAIVQGYRAGADDFMGLVDVEMLRHKIEALLRRAKADPDGPAPLLGRLVCVTAAKGGVGVSTVAANVAVLLARHRPSVCAVDLDLIHGDLQVLLDLRPRAGLAQAARDLAGSVSVQWDDYLVRHEGGPWLLAAPQTALEASELSEAGVSQVITDLRGSYDHLVVDVPNSYGELALTVYEAAERLIVVVSPEITALRRTRELLGVLEGLGVAGEKILLVLNTIFESSVLDRERVVGFLRRPVNIVIPFGGRAFLEAVDNGRPVVTTQKGRAVDALVELTELLRPGPPPPVTRAPARRPRQTGVPAPVPQSV